MTNWEQHFRGMRRKQEHPQFGAFLGSHTIADLKQLVAAQDYTFSQIDGQVPKLLVPPLVLDARVADWMADWQKLKARYATARANAQKTIDSWSIQPDSIRTAEDEYQGVLKSLDSSLANPQLNGYQKGDLQDLYNRMAEIGAHPQFPNMPQPDPKDDFDTQFIQKTESIADVGHAIVHPWDALTGRFKAHPFQSAAIVLAVLVGLRIALTYTPAGMALRAAGKL
jgi:hypothetical protein